MKKFFDLNPEMFGLDISDSSVKVAKLKKRGNFFDIEYINKEDMPFGVVENGEIKKEDDLVKSIKKLTKSLKTKYVAVSLPEEKSFLQVIKIPSMDKKDIKSAVLFQAENYIPLSIDQVYLDFQIIPPQNKDQKYFEILIIAMPKDIVDSYVSCVKKSGLIPVIMEIESQSIIRSVIKKEDRNKSFIVISFGKRNSNIIIFSNNSIRFTSSIYVSSDQITKLISEELNISEEEAEKIKKNFCIKYKDGSEEYRKICKIVEMVLNDFLDQIEKYLSFYREHVLEEKNNFKKQDEKIIIVGGGSNIKNLDIFLTEKTGIKSEIGDVFYNLSLPENKKVKLFKEKEKIISFCTSLGLALRCIKDGE